MASKKLSEKYNQTASMFTPVTAADSDMEDEIVLDAADWGLPVVAKETPVQEESAEPEAASTEMLTEEESTVTEPEEIKLKKKSEVEHLAGKVDTSQYSVVKETNTEEENQAALVKKNTTIGQKEYPGKGLGQWISEETTGTRMDTIPEGKNSLEVEELGGTISYNLKDDGKTYDTNVIHYEGDLGTFDYDPDEFELCMITVGDNTDKTGTTAAIPVLRYVGKETAGNHIEIPDGVTNGDYMFYGDEDLKTMPKLPESLESAHCMFADCTSMTRFCLDARTGENGIPVIGHITGSYGKGGTAEMPSNLKDASMMFMNCTKLEEAFDEAGYSLMDARGMYANTESMEEVMDCGKSFYLSPEFQKGMYYGSPMEGIIQTEVDENGNRVYPNDNQSVYWSEDGEFLNEKLSTDLGMSKSEQEEVMKMQEERKQLMSLTGDTEASVQTIQTEFGQVSTSDMERRSDETSEKEFSVSNLFSGSNGDLLKRGVLGVAQFAILKKLTGSTLIAGGGTIALQCIGMDTVLNKVSEFVGKDTSIGKLLSGWADTLDTDGSSSVFDMKRTGTSDDVTDTVTDSLTSVNTYVGSNGNLDITQAMANNGAYAASEGAFLEAADYSEDSLGAIGAFMDSSVVGIQEKVKSMLAENDGETLTDEQKTELGSLYVGLVRGLDVYDDNAQAEISSTYANSPEDQQKAARGLGKTMRQMAGPLYDSLLDMNEQYDFLTEEQKQMLNEVELTGVTKFGDYTKGMNMAPEVDWDLLQKETEGETEVSGETSTSGTSDTTSEKTTTTASASAAPSVSTETMAESSVSSSRGAEAEEKFGAIVEADEAASHRYLDDSYEY